MNDQFVVCEHDVKYGGGCNFHQIVFTSDKDALFYILEQKLLEKAVIYKLTKFLHELK